MRWIIVSVVYAGIVAFIAMVFSVEEKNQHRESAIMGLKPIGDRVIVRREERAERSPGGIILPDNAKEKPARGKVIAVGPGKMNEAGTARIAMSVKVGDTVLFGKWAGSEHEQKNLGDVTILSESDILAVIEE